MCPLTLDGLARREGGAFGRAARAVAGELAGLLEGSPPAGWLWVVGLGNRAITPDALGPKVHDHTLVTRHLVEGCPEHFGGFRPVAALSAGVLGTTGMESGELVQAVCRRLEPACVVAVDALASRSLKRLCRTVQLSDTGLPPAPGLATTGRRWTGPPWGCRCWRWGVPTVVDGGPPGRRSAGNGGAAPLGEGRDLLVTPRDIDSQVSDLAKVIGYGIGLAPPPGAAGGRDLDLLPQLKGGLVVHAGGGDALHHLAAVDLGPCAHAPALDLDGALPAVVKEEGGGKPQVLPVVRPGRQLIDRLPGVVPVPAFPVRRGEGH